MKALLTNLTRLQKSKSDQRPKDSNHDELGVFLKYVRKRYAKPHTPIGLQAQHFIEDKENRAPEPQPETFHELRGHFPQIKNVGSRAKWLRFLSKYLPFDQKNIENIRTRKREEYKYILEKNEAKIGGLEPVIGAPKYLSIIQKDVERTLSEWRVFKNKKVKQALTNVLYAYAVRLGNKASP